MKARIEKKLSKKLVKAAPSLFKNSWVSPDVTELAENQGSRVKNCLYLGGGVDYWGEGMEAYTVFDSFKTEFPWCGLFPDYPQEHADAYLPNTEGFRATGKNLLNLARKLEKRGNP